MRAPSISLHIDELDLSAVPAPRRVAVADAFVRELTVLITRGPAAWPSPVDQPRARLALDVNAPPHRVGAALAHSVYTTLSERRGGGG